MNPVVIAGRWAFSLQVGAIVVAGSRGADYIVLPDDLVLESLTKVQAALPLDIWGSLFLTAALVSGLSLALRKYLIVSVGHGALAGLYLAIGLGALLSTADLGYGWRTGLLGVLTGVGFIIGAATIHAALAGASLDTFRRRRRELDSG